MMRRLLMTFVLTASTAVALLANHPATFVMRNGERISGDLSYKGGTAYTLNGRDIESRDVAVILFVNGDPSAAELNQIPQVDNNPSEHERHVFVTRDGKVTLGKLYKFSPDGEIVTFDARDGGRRDVSANDMARIYINPAGARSVYSAILRNAQQSVATNDGGVNRSGERPGTTDRGSGDRNGRQPGAPNDSGFDRNNRQPGERYFRAGNNTRVYGNQPWTDSGIDVRKGDLISFSATGEVRVRDGNSRQTVAVGPDGAVDLRSRRNNYPYRDMAVGGLIARVGNDRPFGIGTSTEPISMPGNGRLYLGINADEFGDNGGAFDVAIRDGGFDRNNRQPGERYFGAGNNTRVYGNQPWTDSGIEVRRGDLISFSATGEVRIRDGNSRQTVAAGPDGAVGLRSRRNNYPYRDMAVGGLIARVGNDRPFGIGTSTEPISMPGNGRLYLGINADEFGDNSGAFDVAIRMTRSWR